MDNYLYFYQHLPQHINPNISFGFFSISYYSIMYLVSFLAVYLLVSYRINKDELTISYPPAGEAGKLKAKNYLLDFLLYAFVGLIIGARLGEVIFYNFSYYMADPIRIISPLDPATGQFIGIYGMSYHGGLIGVIIATAIFCWKYRISFMNWANFIVPAVPLGYFFGRLGNFINGELYGRVTSGWWGMYFPGEKNLRHPSQLYEAFLEGVILFAILWPIRNKKWAKNNILALYLLGYAAARIMAEFFRQPDGYIGIFTLGQSYSLLMILAAFLLFLYARKSGIIKEEKKQKIQEKF